MTVMADDTPDLALDEVFMAAVATGERPLILAATRDLVARQMASSEISARDLAALTARFTDVLSEIAALPAPSEGTALDELEQLRRDRERKGLPTARPARARRG